MFNKWVGMGRLTGDVEVKYSQGSDVAIGRFSIAIDRDYKPQGAEKPETDFIKCVAFGKTAEFISKYFGKGNLILVEGSIQTGSYEKDGQKVYFTEVKVDKARFTGEKRNDTQGRPEPQAASSDDFMYIPDGIDEELPFNN